MNVSLKNNDAVSGILKVEIEKNDYAGLLDKNLHKLRQKMSMPGFRKGMVPLSIVKKLYGKHAMAEELNKLVSEKLLSYIRENDIKVLGEPIPNETEQKPLDFDMDEDFEFCFDVALSPVIDVKLTKRDKLNYYQVKIDDELIDKQVDSFLNNYGSYDKADKVEEADLLKGIVTELEDGEPKAGGLLIEDAILKPSFMKGKMEQKKFIGARPDSRVVFNPYKAYKGAAAEIASFLGIEKDKVKDMKSDFIFEIKEITRYKPAEINQVLFDRIFGTNVVQDEAAFRAKTKEYLVEQFTPESEYKFTKDMQAMLLKKAGNVTFAEDVLKRWLLISSDKTEKEQVDDDYPKVIEDLTYRLIKEKLVRDNGIKVEREDLEAWGKRVVRAQFTQYGILFIPDNVLEKYVTDLLKKPETVKNLSGKIIEEKLSALIKNKVTVTVREMTVEEFDKVLAEE
ncbi:MAG: trigger factor [Tannerella sp.]|jgi:trigger factor|nr:trigger factor [Tannerella sp.]